MEMAGVRTWLLIPTELSSGRNLGLPFEIRYRLAWDGKLICALLAAFFRAVNA